LTPMISTKRNQRWILDCTVWNFIDPFCGEKRSEIILSGIDHSTRYMFGKIIPEQNAQNVREFLLEVIAYLGIPKILQTDNGPEFLNKVLSNWCSQLKIKFVQGRAYNPRSQGAIERTHPATKKQLEVMLTSDLPEWVQLRKLCKSENRERIQVSLLLRPAFAHINTHHRRTINDLPYNLQFSIWVVVCIIG